MRDTLIGTERDLGREPQAQRAADARAQMRRDAREPFERRARSASVPITLTNTFACRRSRVTSTARHGHERR